MKRAKEYERRTSNSAPAILLVLLGVAATTGIVAEAQLANCYGHKHWTECEDFGCAQSGTPEAEANRVRTARPRGCRGLCNERFTALRAPQGLTINDFESLQIAANRVGLQGFAIPVGDRKLYRNLDLGNKRTAGEGSLVYVIGYIVGIPRPRRADSANCKIVGRENNNIRFNIAEEADDTEFDSIIAEITPDCRKNCWSLKALRDHGRKPVLVVGQLFYDNKHLVNSDPDNEVAGQPKRLSLWEIHPVTAIFICTGEKSCGSDPTEKSWTPLGKVSDDGKDRASAHVRRGRR